MATRASCAIAWNATASRGCGRRNGRMRVELTFHRKDGETRDVVVTSTAARRQQAVMHCRASAT